MTSPYRRVWRAALGEGVGVLSDAIHPAVADRASRCRPGGIPVAGADPFPVPVTRVTHYTLAINQFTDQVHPSGRPHDVWGYHPALPLSGGMQP